ncbi:hypothetical protein HV824_06445 [Myxococcus sp. AM009]|uniref:hypothetical protein n=1 Tax=unclassified Myxococcus TaxID=2648731 RepID=UPI001595B100|nr:MULTISPECIES: hypothetical protein [unclassified Myxococcus]NVI97757.1 hypothetical protein [Myxococcus sp. AM009]NVJ15836.1 hypothetical protein [Myxococcus sp. AM010]
MVTRKGRQGAAKGARGQAMLEAVLGIIVLVTVLMFGLHFAELAHLSLKAHEAVAAAAWDATAYRVERPGVDTVDDWAWYDSGRIAATRVTYATNERYADWDGRSSTPGDRGPTQLYSQAGTLNTACIRSEDPRNGFRVSATANTPAYGEPGALSCITQGSVRTINLPARFLKAADDGVFSAEHLTRSSFSLCGLGRPAAGDTCRGSLNILLGDHGLTSGEDEERECALLQDDVPGQRCQNRAFYSLAHEGWDRSMGWTGLPERWANDIVGSTPRGRVTGFYLSFRGEESGTFGESHERIWQTQPMDHNFVDDPSLGRRRGTYREAFDAANRLRSTSATRFVYLGKYTCD